MESIQRMRQMPSEEQISNFEESLFGLGEQELYMICLDKMTELSIEEGCAMCNGNGSYVDYDDFRDIKFLTPCFCLLEAIDKV